MQIRTEIILQFPFNILSPTTAPPSSSCSCSPSPSVQSISRQLLVQQRHVVIELRLVVVSGDRLPEIVPVRELFHRELGPIFAWPAIKSTTNQHTTLDNNNSTWSLARPFSFSFHHDDAAGSLNFPLTHQHHQLTDRRCVVLRWMRISSAARRPGTRSDAVQCPSVVHCRQIQRYALRWPHHCPGYWRRSSAWTHGKSVQCATVRPDRSWLECRISSGPHRSGRWAYPSHRWESIHCPNPLWRHSGRRS